jgi:hypothetical protein
MIKATKFYTSVLPTTQKRCFRKGKDPLEEFYGKNLVFVHARTSGLDEKRDLLLEIACAITTKDLDTLSEVRLIASHVQMKQYRLVIFT